MINLTKLLKLGFKYYDNDNLFININDYQIKIKLDHANYSKSTINYGDKIKVHHQGVCNFTKDEYLVQLECVIRLLLKGYTPSSIILEKNYKLGHKDKGRLDICIKKGNKPWALIECKTFDEEFENEKNLTMQNGGQIFSYFSMDRDAKIIGLYTSKICDDIKFHSAMIDTSTIDKNGDQENMHKSWDKHFLVNSIFGEQSGVYEIKETNLRKKDLLDLTEKDSKKLFNDFLEILRKNVISDKSNAFNVIFNLFTCKIYDEDIKSEKEELDLQIKISDNKIDIFKRLSNLYKSSMSRYLSLDISDKYFSSEHKIPLKEFQFIDVYNDETFDLNAEIVISVIRILQKYRVKYFTRHQFLGDFFENLLNTGVKQESGQFFTPIPLTRFILKSLPIDDIIQDKINSKDPYILPHIIDHACGAGHFLTESIEEINAKLKSIDEESLTGQQKRFFTGTKENYLWAKDYIYGIEKDHRLAKTTKIAMFLNGDGDALILSGDGLDDFYKSSNYNGLLKANREQKSVSKFDIVVSNPPFSVDGFIHTIEKSRKNFHLNNFVTSKSNEIECFFIERTLQLLKENGVAALILPLSIFNNNKKIYIQARKLLLLYAEIISIVELRNKTFVATGTSSCIIFLRKRKTSDFISMRDLLSEKLDSSTYLEELNALIDKFNEGDLDNDILTSLNFKSFINLLYKDKKILFSFSGEKKRQEYFLGYRVSKSRGKAGLREISNSLLYSKNSNAKKLDFYIRNSMKNAGVMDFEIDKELSKHLTFINFEDFLEDNIYEYNFKTPSSFLAKNTVKIESISPIGDVINDFDSNEITLSELIKNNEVQIITGLTYSKDEDELPTKTDVRVLTSSNIDIKTGELSFKDKMIYLRDDFPINPELEVKKNDIIMCMSSGSLSHLGKVCLSNNNYQNLLIGGFLNIIRCSNIELATALYYRFMSKEFREYVFSKKGQNINNLKMSDITNKMIRIPKDLLGFKRYIDNF